MRPGSRSRLVVHSTSLPCLREAPNEAPASSIRISRGGPTGDSDTLRTLGQGLTEAANQKCKVISDQTQQNAHKDNDQDTHASTFICRRRCYLTSTFSPPRLLTQGARASECCEGSRWHQATMACPSS